MIFFFLIYSFVGTMVKSLLHSVFYSIKIIVELPSNRTNFFVPYFLKELENAFSSNLLLARNKCGSETKF